MNTEKRVIACVDQSAYAESVTDHAAWAATRLGAPLELLHVIDRHPEKAISKDHSGAIGPDAQVELLKELSGADEALVRAAREDGRLFLNRLRERALAAGAAVVDVRQRLGHLDETLHELQDEARLIVMGRRGVSAGKGGVELGSNVERVVRALNLPILTVAEAPFKAPERIVLAYDGGAATRKGVEMVAGSELLRGLVIRLAMAGDAQSGAESHMAWAIDILRAAGFQVESEVVPGDVLPAIHGAVVNYGADWLLMGAYTHSPWRNFFKPSSTNALLKSVGIPTLLLR